MPDAGTLIWMLALVGGPVLLGLAIAYGLAFNKRRTMRQQVQTERGTREVYDKEEERRV
jgi:hypothetical protein